MTSAPRPALQLDALHFAYPQQPPVFAGWSADVPAGVTLLHGDTGSGKSTLLRLLAGELQGRGTATLDGRVLAGHAEARPAQLCWFDPRDDAWDALTPEALRDALAARHGPVDTAAWAQHAAGFGLSPHLAKPLYALSTGSRRKAGLAVALSLQCPLVLIDDATAGLDAGSIAHLVEALGAIGAAQERGDAAPAVAAPRVVLVASSHGLEAVPHAHALVLPGPQAAR